jgi:cytochrome b561
MHCSVFHFAVNGIGILIILMLIMGNIFNEFPKDLRPNVYMVHKATGILILALVAGRIFWRIINVQPKLPAGTSKLIHLGASAGHIALYILMIAMPLSGWLFMTGKYPLTFYGLFDVPMLTSPEDKDIRKLARELHEPLANILIAIISVHVLAALYHHRILKDNVLTRMLPSCGKCKKKD